MLFNYINLAFEILTLFAGIYCFKNLDRTFRLLFFFVVFAVSTEFSLTYVIQKWSMDTRPASHFYVPIEFLFFTLIYIKQLGEFINRKILVIVALAFITYCAVNIIFIQDLYEYPYTRAISALILVLFSILYYNKIMVEAKLKKLAKEPMIWLNTGVLIYYAGTFFYHILFNIILKFSLTFSRLTVSLFIGLNILFYFAIGMSFIKMKIKSKV